MTGAQKWLKTVTCVSLLFIPMSNQIIKISPVGIFPFSEGFGLHLHLITTVAVLSSATDLQCKKRAHCSYLYIETSPCNLYFHFLLTSISLLKHSQGSDQTSSDHSSPCGTCFSSVRNGRHLTARQLCLPHRSYLVFSKF